MAPEKATANHREAGDGGWLLAARAGCWLASFRASGSESPALRSAGDEGRNRRPHRL